MKSGYHGEEAEIDIEHQLKVFGKYLGACTLDNQYFPMFNYEECPDDGFEQE